eukprot:GHRR01029239.1.p1 GENE.GHRR01029239.1~~GHRR01029239.1.p1  ORF type:complete len:181 (+),score=37.66 GHRR01029239.1:219-761(+)
MRWLQALLIIFNLALLLAEAIPDPQSWQTRVHSSIAGTSRHLQSSCETSSFPELKPTYLESRAAGVEWAGADDQHVFTVTAKSMIWRSKDGGSTFEDITERFNGELQGINVLTARHVSLLCHIVHSMSCIAATALNPASIAAFLICSSVVTIHGLYQLVDHIRPTGSNSTVHACCSLLAE